MDNLPAPEVIAREIVEDLTAALAEFEAVAAALERAADASAEDDDSSTPVSPNRLVGCCSADRRDESGVHPTSPSPESASVIGEQIRWRCRKLSAEAGDQCSCSKAV